MTIKTMIRSHDDSALEALTSRGLLRRAHRDLASGRGRVITVDDRRATVSIDDLTVELDPDGPGSSSCTCRAHGVCRHILHAVLLLRDRQGEAGEPEAEPDVSNAVTQICALADAQVVKFAGADWDKAIGLAADDPGTTFEDEGINVTVRMTEMNAAVTFIAGKGLKDAAYKGPRTRRRLLTTLAALAVRQRAGLQVADSVLAPAASPSPNAEFIDQAQKTLEQAVSATLPSRSLLARDLMLDLAISTRCEALPRLAAELRALARQAQLANERSVEFEHGSFMLDASRSYALLEVLRTSSPDPVLGGSIRRNYEKHEQVEVWPLGVSRWRSKTGARGLSAYVLDPANNRWLTVIEGRSAGVDNSFDVANAYATPVWGAGTMSGLMGRRVRLPDPRITSDGSISSKDQPGSECLQAPLTPDEIIQSPAMHKNWESLRKDLAIRMGTGIRRTPTPLPALISPSGFGRLGFDDVSQCYNWEVIDEAGESLVLEIPADDDESALRLWKLGGKTLAIIVEAQLANGHLAVRPVSVMLRQHNRALIHNVDFDDWPVESRLKKALSKVSENFAKPLATSPTDIEPLNQMAADAAEELVGIVSGSTDRKTDSILRRLNACGLATLARGIERASERNDMRSVFQAAYAVSEIEAIRAFE